jgi:ATP-dependent Lon protease
MTNKPRPQLQPGETRAYPVLPLRDIVVFPHMIVPLFVGREKSIKALEEVMRSDTFILLATQKNASDDDPATDAIFEVGTLASVLQLLKLPDGTVKVLVEGATNITKLTPARSPMIRVIAWKRKLWRVPWSPNSKIT